MVDKNSSLKNSFFDDVRQGIDQIPAFLEDTLTRTTELPFVAFSNIVVEPVLRFLVPGTSEEERQRIKADIAAKDETQAAFLEGARERIQNILQLPPRSREQILAIRQLEDDMVAIGYPKTTVMDVLNKGREFFFGDTYDVHKRVADGDIRPSELEGQDLANYFIGFVDVADVAGIGTGIVNSIRRALSRQDFGALKNIAETLPSEKAQEVSNLLSNKINPTKKFYSDPKNFKEFKNKKDLTTILSLAEIIDNTPIDQLDGSFKSIILDNNLENLILNKGVKPGVKNNLKKYGLISDEKFAKIEENAKGSLQKFTTKASEVSRKKILDGVDNAIKNNIFYDTRKDFAEAIDMDSSLLNSFRNNYPELKEKVDNIIIRNTSGYGESIKPRSIFMSETAKIFSNKTDLNKYLRTINPETFKKINDLRRAGDYKTETLNPFHLFQNYMYDKFRSIKQTKGNEKLTTRDFVNKYMTDQDLEDFPRYVDLELQRTNANVAARDIINELAKNEKYRPYLLNKDNEIDYKLLQFDKAHDIPLFVTRTEGSGRLQNVGRFKGAGVETELIQPNLQPYNNLQKNLDPYANILGDILNQEGLKKEFSKVTDLKINDETLTRKNPINQKLLNMLEDYGYKPNLKKFNNQYELIEEIAGVIDGLYKDRLIRTIVPITKKSGKKDTVIFGIEDPKAVSLNQKVELGATRLQEILDYAIENNLKPSDIKNEGGYLKSFNQGGEVETEQENQSFLSKAATTIGNILIPQAEALPLPKNFLLGDVPKINKKVEVKPELPAPEAPLMEKRYNIFDENGQKVYQSKSIDDAQQKALRLEDLEGKTFTVKEVEVPIKVKKSKTTKPGTALVPTVTPDTIIGSGNSKLFYSDLKGIINTDTGNLTIKGVTVPADSVSMSAKEWHDWFRSSGIKEGELYDSYVRSYLNKKGGFNRETGKFTNDQKISYAEIKELVDTSPTNYIQSVSYSDAAGNLKYGNTGRQDGAINGSRVERVLWLDSKDIRGDIGSLPEEIRRYEGHSSMRNVQSSNDFSVQNNTLNGEPYVIGWSLNSNRIGQLNNKPIIVNVADEIQSDFLQKAASLKSKIKKEIRDLVQGTNILPGGSDELNALYKRLENVFRPMPATYAQLKKSIDELLEADAIFQKIGDMEMDDITKASFKELGEAAKKRDKALATINATIDDIDTRELFPNIPFKDQKDWVDAIIKNDLYHAAKARFSFDESGNLVVNQDAPAYYAVAPAKAVKAYRGGRGVELTPDNPDRSGTMVAYDMQYGGPNLNDHTGQHFTSNVEESLNKIANMKNSKVEVGQVNFGFAGEGVDTFMIELTPDMLMPYKAYKKDGGLVKKSILYTPIVSIDKLLSPIGASRW